MPSRINESMTLISTQSTIDTQTTTIVCLISSLRSVQTIFLNSDWSPWNQLFFWLLPADFSFPCIAWPHNSLWVTVSSSYLGLLCFLMQSVFAAELTIFLCFKTLRMILFLLGHIVVTLLALRTCQCDLYAHNFPPRFYTFFAGDSCENHQFLGIKKKPKLPFACQL